MGSEKTLTINACEKGAALGDLFGIFFEDLNHAADGGMYAELVQNRSFEFEPIDNPSYHSLTAWEKVERSNGKAEIYVEESNPLNERNTHYLVINVLEPGDGSGIMNAGYNTGIPIIKGHIYNFSFYAKQASSLEQTVHITLESISGEIHAQEALAIHSSDWVKYEAALTAGATDYSGRLVIALHERGKLCIDMVSLFPEKTFKNRSNGMREDIAQLLADLKPKFMRFPGGCLVHDGSLDPDARNSMYRWKNTIGAVEKRPARRSNWGYNQTLGIGYYEYFIFCEDIGAKPIPILPAGYDPHHKRIVPIKDLQPWIDDALDLIEFANGDILTEWGAKRAELGHPEPFGLEYIGVGNEEVGEPFFERYAYFHKAIKAKHPDIKIINTSGPFAAGGEYERGWKSANENGSDLVDEHYYQTPEWFLANHHRYDHFKSNGPKVFLGEYASWGNTYYNALVEASYMIGLERNAHAVGLACYAPLLCNTDYVNWKPDMIWFNNHEAFGTANYYVQKLFMNHQGDRLLKINGCGLHMPKEQKSGPITGKIAIAGDQIASRFYDIRLRNRDTGEEKSISEITDQKGCDSFNLFNTEWRNYSLSLKAIRNNGEKGFFVHFGEKDENNRFRWEIGGWQNQDSVILSFINGRGACLTQSLFSVETDREYNLMVDVNERHIRTYIDGEPINTIEDKLPVTEPLYYSASMENTTGDIILKVVNVQDAPEDVKIVVEGINKELLSGKIFKMNGYEPEDVNSFTEPRKIAIEEAPINIKGNTLCYEFPKQSITIFRLNSSQSAIAQEG